MVADDPVLRAAKNQSNLVGKWLNSWLFFDIPKTFTLNLTVSKLTWWNMTTLWHFYCLLHNHGDTIWSCSFKWENSLFWAFALFALVQFSGQKWLVFFWHARLFCQQNHFIWGFTGIPVSNGRMSLACIQWNVLLCIGVLIPATFLSHRLAEPCCSFRPEKGVRSPVSVGQVA